MGYHITTSDMRDGYVQLIDAVEQFGDRVSPRGEPTIELTDVLISLEDPTNAIPYGVGRKLNMAIASAEFVQLLGGYSDVEQLESISSVFTRFTDRGRLRGAYGPRLFNQWKHLLHRLIDDPDTRQGVVTIWRADELITASHDVPCTISLSYSIRDGKLFARTHMRSNDLWLGTPYDFGQFTALQRTLADALDLDLGTYTHFVNSLHLYERDREATNAVVFEPTYLIRDLMPPVRLGNPQAYVDPVDRFSLIQAQARRIGSGTALGNERDEHFERLKGHFTTRPICRACRYTFDSSEDLIGDKLCGECMINPQRAS